jgi:hypothetical protein
MKHIRSNLRHITLACALAISTVAPVWASIADHQEFEATLHVPFRADPAQLNGNESRYFTLEFDFPLAEREQAVSWRVELLGPDGRIIERWYGVEKLWHKPVSAKVFWAGRARGRAGLADGLYEVRMTATAQAAGKNPAALAGQTHNVEQNLAQTLLREPDQVIVQSWPIEVGAVAAQAMPKFSALPTRAPMANSVVNGVNGTAHGTAKAAEITGLAAGGLPYTVYYGNLHSQTNHSDGGGNLAACTGAQTPQKGAFGPADAYQYAATRGLNFLMTSEHNHMYDGSDNTNASASPATAKSLFQSGLAAASTFNAAHPGFLGIYGLEWGVINNGGHLNIFNASELLEWEYNSSGQLIGDTYSAKGDYAALYTLMRQRGWIGQFNHPASSGQFVAGGVALGYTADGDQAMVLCEVLNTSAFSTNTSESETGQSSYQSACNKALEAGYHVAFSTNQDNHCANWGASSTNRTGVLLPDGAALNSANFIAALKARRVFASMDKNSQLVLTANGHVMGERFSNTGALTLLANFANSFGRSVKSVVIYQGVPKRNGTVTQLSATASTTFTPTVGEHFYYAKITQDDGKSLWSAPVWVTQY